MLLFFLFELERVLLPPPLPQPRHSPDELALPLLLDLVPVHDTLDDSPLVLRQVREVGHDVSPPVSRHDGGWSSGAVVVWGSGWGGGGHPYPAWARPQLQMSIVLTGLVGARSRAPAPAGISAVTECEEEQQWQGRVAGTGAAGGQCLPASSGLVAPREARRWPAARQHHHLGTPHAAPPPHPPNTAARGRPLHSTPPPHGDAHFSYHHHHTGTPTSLTTYTAH